MSARNDGGAAFPVNTANVNNPGACFADGGMTLRDYFAAKAPISTQDAMTACFVDSSSIGTLAKSKRIEVMQKLAEMQLEYADAMLTERAK